MSRASDRLRRATRILLATVCGFALLTSCTTWQDDPEPQIGTDTQAIHSSHSGAAPWPHVLTCYGGCAAPHYDPSACNHATSCGPIANGNWWYATERAAFYCGAKLKLVRGNKCVVVEVQDNGPASWVEDQAGATCGVADIIDTSPLVHDYFGGGCGWSECYIVYVSQVPDNTPTGPAGCQVCNPGQVQTDGCGNCGTKTRTCASNGQWGSWSSCTGQGPCAAGATQNRSCCDCGSQSRTCNASCQWNEWGGCNGPDPAGGSQVCDTEQPGPCADGRVRCVGGCLECARVYEPVAELCDGIDNDCSGEIDDGSPQVMGTATPAFAASLVDFTYPSSLRAGQDAPAWVEFENAGSEVWPRGEIWLGSVAAASGDPSQLYSDGNWPAWDVVAILRDQVEPGQIGHFDFTIKTPAISGEWIVEDFQLTDPTGEMMSCPSPGLPLEVLVSSGTPEEDSAADNPADDLVVGPIEGGCSLRASARSDDTSSTLTIVLLLSALVVGRRRRAATAEKEK